MRNHSFSLKQVFLILIANSRIQRDQLENVVDTTSGPMPFSGIVPIPPPKKSRYGYRSLSQRRRWR